jgi:hypothetical protein
MTKLPINLLAIPVAISLFSGCATAPVQTGPSNIRGVKEFALEPVKYENLLVDDLKEDDYKAKQSQNHLQQWDDDKEAIKSRFATTLAESAAKASLLISDSAAGQRYTIRPVISKIDTGYYRIPAWNAVTRIYMHISVIDLAGKTVDETDVQGSKSFDAIAAPDAGGRLRSSANEIGDKYARYLEKRTRS